MVQSIYQRYGSYFFKKRVDKWAVPADLVPGQTFLVHGMHFVGNMDNCAALEEKGLHISLLQWSDKW